MNTTTHGPATKRRAAEVIAEHLLDEPLGIVARFNAPLCDQYRSQIIDKAEEALDAALVLIDSDRRGPAAQAERLRLELVALVEDINAYGEPRRHAEAIRRAELVVAQSASPTGKSS